tara:strand:+ start:1541 stop:1942 length:402 start_codon:yes stop_codon:yes gene_type:complete
MKKADLQIIIKFFSFLVVILSIVAYGQILILKNNELWSTIIRQGLFLTYLFNGVITLTIFSTLIFLKKKYMASLGFFFLAGSLVKIILFFILFRPGYSADGLISNLEFAEFFVPYGVCLFFEVFYMVRVLMKD